MKRDLYKQLLKWKTSLRRKPLILRGARQVGKTYLLKTFGKQEYESFIYLNFESDSELKKFFNSALKPKDIIEKISLYNGQKISNINTLIFFDEIQECPEALNSLKYFQEEANEFHIVAAGSLLGVKLAHTKGFPVGKVDFLELHPLSFGEFLTALDRENLKDYLLQIKEMQPIPEPLHVELLNLLKRYMYVGGMPEAVLEYIQTQDLLEIRKIHEAILKAYELDFAKHAPKEDLMKITTVWNSIPRQLAKENKKFIFSIIKDSARGREYENSIQWLYEAGLINKAYNLSSPKLPFPNYGDTNAFKVFLLDVGLLAAMSNVPAKIVVDESIFSEFYGAFTENFIAQELKKENQNLYYWSSSGTAEIDFILEQDLKIYPLEVKSGTSNKKKSLIVYDQKYNPDLLLRTSQMNLKLDGKILNIPLYSISNFLKYLNSVSS